MRLAWFGAIVLAGCAVGPDYARPNFVLPERYITAYNEAVASSLWWEGFSDPLLNTLVDQALDDNLSITIAEARLRQAEAFTRAERSDLFPQIDGALTGQIAQPGPEGANVLALGTFTPDLFGDRRRELEAAKASARGAEASLDDARRLAAAFVTSAYIELRRTDSQIALLEQSLELQTQTLRIVRLRAEAGLAADLDVQRAASDLAQTRAQSGPLIASRSSAEYTVQVLLGQQPGAQPIAKDEDAAIPVYGAGPSVGVPANLLRARPDLRVAEADLIAATAAIGAEVADLYPSLDLSGLVTTNIDGIDAASGTVSTLSAVLDIPFLDAGRRRAEVVDARANADAALAIYQQALLNAFQDTENALLGIEAARAQRADLQDAVRASEIAFDQLQALYREGLATLIDVLDAQRQLIASRESFVESEAALAQAYVSLYAASGAPTKAPDA